ncbi:hypothetical protein R1sor_001978 [Riccia sorocarpa]|uniref:Uncharacterized protein n=1 Tax=Riccia sorocarpa TaxID=122646 RepID=A0ABD3GZG1_9MARC
MSGGERERRESVEEERGRFELVDVGHCNFFDWSFMAARDIGGDLRRLFQEGELSEKWDQGLESDWDDESLLGEDECNQDNWVELELSEFSVSATELSPDDLFTILLQAGVLRTPFAIERVVRGFLNLEEDTIVNIKTEVVVIHHEFLKLQKRIEEHMEEAESKWKMLLEKSVKMEELHLPVELPSPPDFNPILEVMEVKIEFVCIHICENRRRSHYSYLVFAYFPPWGAPIYANLDGEDPYVCVARVVASLREKGAIWVMGDFNGRSGTLQLMRFPERVIRSGSMLNLNVGVVSLLMVGVTGSLRSPYNL